MRANNWGRRAGVVAALALICALATATAMSIESEPVKVTHRNSGPRYNIDEVERTKLEPDANEAAPQREPAAGQDAPKPDEPTAAGDDEARNPAIGHVSIRRIFLVPMMAPRPDWQAGEANSGEQPPNNDDQQPSGAEQLSRPIWPFLAPLARPQPERFQRPHLFGADEASRSPSEHVFKPHTNLGPMTEEEREPPMRNPNFDAYQLMLALMQQAISGQLAPPMPQPDDLNKEAATNNNADGKSDSTGLGKPMNETKEDIVEIEGKKFLRKMVINRHVGQNIVFMTKRLIFVPLNETESTATTGTTETAPTTTSSSTTTGSNVDQMKPTTTGKPENEELPVRPSSPPADAEETTTTTTSAPTTTETSTSPEPSSTQPRETSTGAASSDQTTSTVVATGAEELTTTNSADKPTEASIEDRVEKALERVAERLVESMSKPTSTEKP